MQWAVSHVWSSAFRRCEDELKLELQTCTSEFGVPPPGDPRRKLKIAA